MGQNSSKPADDNCETTHQFNFEIMYTSRRKILDSKIVDKSNTKERKKACIAEGMKLENHIEVIDLTDDNMDSTNDNNETALVFNPNTPIDITDVSDSVPVTRMIQNAAEMTVASVPERKTLKRKIVSHPPIAEMVIDSIKTLKKRNGVTPQHISNYIEQNYSVSTTQLKYYIDRFLQKSVTDGLVEKIQADSGEDRFKIKKAETVKKNSNNVKPVKKMAEAKQPDKN